MILASKDSVHWSGFLIMMIILSYVENTSLSGFVKRGPDGAWLGQVPVLIFWGLCASSGPIWEMEMLNHSLTMKQSSSVFTGELFIALGVCGCEKRKLNAKLIWLIGLRGKEKPRMERSLNPLTLWGQSGCLILCGAQDLTQTREAAPSSPSNEWFQLLRNLEMSAWLTFGHCIFPSTQ